MNKKILVGLSITIILVIVGLMFGFSRNSLELNLQEGEQAFDFRRIEIAQTRADDENLEYSSLVISQLELLPEEIREAESLVDFENEILVGIIDGENCNSLVTEENLIISFQNENDDVFSAFLVSNCTEGLDILSISGLFAVVNRDDLPPELLVELDSMEEFEFPPIWKSIFDIE